MISMLHHRACSYNREEVVEYMLKYSEHTPLANLNRGDTPLHCACNKNNVRLAEMLLDHSSRLAIVCDTIMDKRYSPLHIVCMEQCNIEIVKMLLEKINKLLETDEYNEDSPLDMNVRDAEGCTPLYYACYYGHDEIVSLLLKFGHHYKNCQPFDVTIKSLQQRTPLHAAVHHLSTMKVILDYYTGQKNKSFVQQLINLVGRPSINTKLRLLRTCSSSTTSICSITSQAVSTDAVSDVFPTIAEECEGDDSEEQLFQKSLSNASNQSKVNHLTVLPKKSDTLPTRPLRAMTSLFKSNQSMALQQQAQSSKRQRSKTDSDGESSAGRISLFLTKDGTFLALPLEHRLEDVDKEFDQLLITPLAEACACGYSQAVDMLLSAGASDAEGVAIRLAQFGKNHELARTVLSHHCKMVMECSQQQSYTLSIDWSGMKITELADSWFLEGSLFFPSSAEDEDGKDLPMASLPTELTASTLTNVLLKNNNLSSLPEELLQLPNLQSLDVSFNHITTISPKLSCPSLKYLNLSDNKLVELPMTIWYLPHLEELEVKKNILQSVGEGSINSSNLSQLLKAVDISYNKLDELPSFVLELPVLEELNVSHNELISLPQNLWKCCTLRELDVSHNMLTKLPLCEPQSTLMSSDQPHAIPAVHCGRKVVGAKAHVQGNFDKFRSRSYKRNTTRFVNALETPQEVYSEELIYNSEGCCGIQKINLSRNKLYTFPDALPCLAPSLAELDISHNIIEEIDISFLPQMLRKLVASHNKIEKFGTFVNPQLKSHMIRCCRMVDSQHQECHHRSHKEMKNLTIIYVSNNRLKYFQLLQSLETDKKSQNKQTDKTSPQHIPVTHNQLDLLYRGLENLDVSHNSLQGCFNHNIGYQSQLKSINLNSNTELEELPMEFAYFKKRKNFTRLSMQNLPKLRDPPIEYHNNKLRTLLSYMSSRLKR